MLEQRELAGQRFRKSLIFHDNRKHRPEPIRHLPLQPLLILQTGMVDLHQYLLHDLLFTPRRRRRSRQRIIQPRNQLGRVLTRSLHPNLQCTQTTHTQPTLQISHDMAKRGPILKQLTMPLCTLDTKHPAEHIAMAAEILGTRVQHDICTPEERILQARRSKRAVDDEVGSTRMSLLRVRFDAECGAEWVHRCLEEDHITFLQVFCGTVQRELLESCETGENTDDFVAAVVAFANGDAPWVQKDQGCM